MKASKNILAIVALMAAGVAGAAGTPAGTGITNQATASYTDPAGGAGSSISNIVTTVVLPKPSFDISYASSSDDGSGVGTNPANSATVNTPEKTNAAPGATVIRPYTVTNTGNVPLTIDLSALTSGGATATITSDAQGKTPFTDNQITVKPGETPTIYLVTTTPSTGAPGSVSGATPIGRVTGTGVGTATQNADGTFTITGNGIQNTDTSNNILHENQSTDNTGTPVANDHVKTVGTAAANDDSSTDMQYLAIIANPSALTNNPNGSTDGGTTTTVTNTGTPPGGDTPQHEYPAVTPPVTPPGGGTTPGGTTTPTPIYINGDEQVAYPPADAEKINPDVVTFTNTIKNGAPVTNTDNTTNSPDHVILAPGGKVPTKLDSATGTYVPDLVANTTQVTDANNVVWTYQSPGTWKDTNNNIVQFIVPGGADGKTPTLSDTITVNPNSTANYTTQVTYPDSNPNAITDPATAPTTADKPAIVKVQITTTSGNNPNVSDITKDTIMPPAATFGDTNAVAQANGIAEDPSKVYGPGGNVTPAKNDGTNTTAPGTNGVKFPMSISNTGQYDDTYQLQGYVNIPLVGGGTKTVAVKYTDANGNVLPQATNADGTPKTVTVNGVTVPVYVTPSVPKNSFLKVNATVDVPTDAASTAKGADSPVLNQTATGVVSTIAMQDTNDVLPIGPKGDVVVAKFTNTNNGKNVVTGTSPTLGAQVGYNSANGPKGQTTVVTSTTSGIPTDASQYVRNPAGYDGVNATQYLPGVDYDYQIIGKNTYNGPITGLALSDTLKAQMLFQSATCNVYDSNYPATNSVVVAAGDLADPVPANNAAGATVACKPVVLQPGQVQVLDIHVKLQ